MEHFLVITAIGTDRPGISDEVTHLVTDCGCNIVDSRIALLGSEFTLIMLLSGNNNAISRVESTLPLKAQQHELLTVMKRTSKHEPRPYAYTADFSIEAEDNPGLVERFTHFIATRNINITALSAHTNEADKTENSDVAAKLVLQFSTTLPEDVNLMQLQEDYEALCQELSAEGTVTFITHSQ